MTQKPLSSRKYERWRIMSANYRAWVGARRVRELVVCKQSHGASEAITSQPRAGSYRGQASALGATEVWNTWVTKWYFCYHLTTCLDDYVAKHFPARHLRNSEHWPQERSLTTVTVLQSSPQQLNAPRAVLRRGSPQSVISRTPQHSP